jgi:hypothetical protein
MVERTVDALTSEVHERQTDDELHEQLVLMVEKLSHSLTERGILQWMETPSRYLKGETPLNLLTARHYSEVAAAVEAFDQGVYL